jgi:tetratricopeptide (TPR) repeat protein
MSGNRGGTEMKSKWPVVLILGLAVLLAILLLHDTIKPSPTSEELYQQYLDQGDSYLEQERWDEAIAEYSEAIELNPEFADAYAQRALAVLLEQEYYLTMDCLNEAAIRDAEKALALNPAIGLDRRLARAYAFQGDCYYEDRKYDEAAASYAKAMELDPNISCRTPSTVYIDQIEQDLLDRQYDRAIMYIGKALAFEPEDTEYYYHKLAEAYYGRGFQYLKYWEPDDAIADFSRAIELNPDEAKYYYYRGETYYQLADYYWDAGQTSKEVDSNNKAIADFSKAIELGLNNAETYNRRGNCYAAKGDYNKAISDYTRAIETDYPEIDAVYYYNRAGAYKELGDKNKALADYRTALELSDDEWMMEQISEAIKELESDLAILAR